jgi:membrane-bound metal-dependent hydrolase YbcI (DUF457 family)
MAAISLRLIAELFWILLVFSACIIAARYVERLNHPLVGWLLFGGLAFLTSLARARLFLRISDKTAEGIVRGVGHVLVYLLAASAVYLLICLLGDQRADLALMLPLWLGALLPDLDSRLSLLGRLLPFLSRRLEARLGRSGSWHSLATNLVLALMSMPLIFLFDWQVWAVLWLGFFVHLFVDLWRPQGIPLLWPLSGRRVRILGVLDALGDGEWILVAALATAITLLLFPVELGRPVPPSAPTPTYEQSVDRYYSMRGRNLVYAWVEGSWQASGRRIRGTFEVLNVVDESFVMLDRYDGKVFTAGRSPTDNLYVNRISLSEGASVRIKPVEIQLEGAHLRDALPVLYQMQDEAGLQHIYISGDLFVSETGETVRKKMRGDYAQTSLRKVEAHGNGHFTLRYLTAAELIELADIYMDYIDLVITAVYETPASGPTATPLPGFPTQIEGGQ